MACCVSIKDSPYNAVGDGVADDTAALNAAFALVGRRVFIPSGTYLHGQLDVPRCAEIFGESALESVLKPNGNVTTALSIANVEYAPDEWTVTGKLSCFTIDGDSTSGATGIFLGHNASAAVQVDDVRVKNFGGVDAVGLRVGDVLKSSIRMVTAEHCTTNLLIRHASDALLPTTVHFDSCVFTDAQGVGARLENGWNLTFSNCDFESSGQEGTLLQPVTGRLNQITFENCWWEDNCRSTPGAFQFRAEAQPYAGNDWAVRTSLRDSHFALGVDATKAIHMHGGGVQGFVISNPTLVSRFDESIVVTGGAFGQINEWQGATGTYADMVSDPLNLCGWGDFGDLRSWTPTFGALGGQGSAIASANVQIADYRFDGRMVTVALDASVTLSAGVSPNAITISLPVNLAPAKPTASFASLIVTNGSVTAFESGMIGPFTDGNLYARKIDNSPFAAGSQITIRSLLTYPK